MRRHLGYVAGSAIALGVVAALAVPHRHELAATLGHLSAGVFGLAVVLHLASLFARAEAWRVTLLAIERRPVPWRSLHLATATGFLAGIAETHLAMPTRLAILRRLAPDAAPRVPQMLLTDIPMMALEGCCAAVLLVIAASALPAMPLWALPVVLVGAAGGLVGIRLAHERLATRSLFAGLAILGTPGLRGRLAGLAVSTVALTLARVGVLLAGCRVPSDPAHLVLVYLAVSLLGLVPIGPASNAAATLATVGATSSVGAATAVGLAIAATSIAGVVVYVLIALAAAALRGPAPGPAGARLRAAAAPRGSRSAGSWPEAS